MIEGTAQQVEILAEKFFKAPASLVLNLHRRIKAKYPTVRIAGGEWLRIIGVSTILGLALYGGIVGLCYHIASSTMLGTRAQFADSWPAELTAGEAAAITLDDLGVSQDRSHELETAIEASRASDLSPDRNKPVVLGVITSLLLANSPGSCGDCSEDCVLAVKPILVRMLLGWPTSEAERALDVKFLHDTFDVVPAAPPNATPPTPNQKQRACEKVQARRSLSAWQPDIAMVAWRQEPWPAPMVAQLVLGARHCGASESDQAARDRCQLLTRLLQTVIDDSDVKTARSFLVDFFYGWERALVFILAFVVALALRRQRKARSRLDIEAEWVRQRLASRELAIGLDPTDPSSQIDPEAGRAAITMEDEGPGIPRSEREKVFEPFYRVGSSRDPDTGGVGLGLSVTRSIIWEHGGDITLGARKGGGLTVRVELPAEHPSRREQDVAAGPPVV